MRPASRRKRLITTLLRLRAQREQERDRLRILLMGAQAEMAEMDTLIARDSQTLDRFIGMIGKRRVALREKIATLRQSMETLSMELKREEKWIDGIEDDQRRERRAAEELARDEDLAARLAPMRSE